jgi:hypothetical protein
MHLAPTLNCSLACALQSYASFRVNALDHRVARNRHPEESNAVTDWNGNGFSRANSSQETVSKTGPRTAISVKFDQ